MRYFLAGILFFSTTLLAFSQTYEIGGFVGGSNYIGDIGKTNYIAPSNFAFGGILKWNRSPRHSFRASIIAAGISGDDTKSSEPRREERGYKFDNTILEFSAGLEYTFWEFSMYSGQPQQTPYLYTGLTYFRYKNLYKRFDDEIVEDSKAGTMAIPMVVGYKFTIGTNAVMGFEIGARYTFTDNLDGSNPVGNLKDNENLRFGNTNSDDWYVFSGLTLTFTFGRRPCYCNF